MEDGSRAADQMEEKREAPPPQPVASPRDPVSKTISASFRLAIALKFTLLEGIEEENSNISS